MPHRSFHILFNASAGTVLKTGQEVIEAKIAESGIPVASVHFVEGKEIMNTLRDLKKTGEPILLGGGDGTLMRSAAEFLDAPGQLGIIPMGTMNLLANDLGFPIDIAGALAAYAKGARKIAIDVGVVNGKSFLCCAALGVIPKASELREEHRGEAELLLIPRLAMFVFEGFSSMKRRFQVRLDGRLRHLRTAILVISNNLLKEDIEEGDHAFQKESLQDGKLGIYTLRPHSFWEKLRLVFRLKLGNWKKDPVLTERVARQVEVRTGLRQEEVSLDGETQTLSTPLRFSVLRRGLTLLVPMHDTTTSAAA